MPTTKFDRILLEFSNRIGNRLDSAFTPGAGAFPAGNLLEAADAISIVNKALHKYQELNWQRVQGNRKTFVSLFPELLKLSAAITFTTGIYTVASPHLDFFALFDGYKTSVPFRVAEEDALTLLITGKYPRHAPSATKPIIAQRGTTIRIFPTTETTGFIFYIMQPLLPTTGAFIVQNGTVDSPYYPTRHSMIAGVAEELYWNEKQADRR